MNSEPKAFASLSSGLLARKGAARPAMRPQGFGQIGGTLEDLGWNDMGFEPPKAAETPLRDADHDAFGEEIHEPSLLNPISALTPVDSPVHSQQAEIADRFHAEESDEEVDEDFDETAELYEPQDDAEPLEVAEPLYVPEPIVVAPVARIVSQPAVRRVPSPRSAPGSKAKAAFTLRLDPDRHLKLRLACAVDGRSAQMLVTDALDAFLAGIPELDAMAARANRKG